MQEINFKLLRAHEADLGVISDLAAQIWETHYISIIGEQQVKYMLEKMYNLQSLLEQIGQKKHIFYLIQQHGNTVGFLSVNKETGNDWFLNKFYIHSTRASNGLGTMVFEELKKIIQPQKITLTVNRQNYKSINFYFKNKFRIDHVADFDIGGGYVMNDFVMVYHRAN